MKTVTFNERSVRIAVWVVIVLAIVAAGGKLAGFLKENGPKAPKVAPEIVLPQVRVMEVVTSDVDLELTAQGDVEAVRQTRLLSEVGGRVLKVSPRMEAGEIFKSQEFVLQIDRTDYQAALANAQASVEDAKLATALEEAQAERAVRDWAKLGNGRKPGELVLRKPQLAATRAREVAAQAAMDKALADLERTRVVVPYDCRVLSTSVDLGATVSPGTPLLEVLSLGAVDVRLPLSLEDYGFLAKNEDGEFVGEVSAAALIGGVEKIWTGTLIRSEEIVERSTRSINVVVRFDGDDVPPPGLFVNSRIKGMTLKDRVVLPRSAMLDAKRVLLVTKESTLEFREVDVERTEDEWVVIRGGLKEGEQVCLTPLSTPVTGMKVEIAKEDPEAELEEEPTL
ncbi:MAG: efflux RND transporter periplasmic adaptor subunit [Akkermansiaceae bacterium]|nr:efflux RND transporter periplasmic adaptor subunit [Akkermansiaceae bacterium]